MIFNDHGEVSFIRVLLFSPVLLLAALAFLVVKVLTLAPKMILALFFGICMFFTFSRWTADTG